MRIQIPKSPAGRILKVIIVLIGITFLLYFLPVMGRLGPFHPYKSEYTTPRSSDYGLYGMINCLAVFTFSYITYLFFRWIITGKGPF